MALVPDEDRSDISPPDPHFDAIGRVAFAWSNLESELGRVLVAMLHAPIAATITNGQPYSVIYGHIEAVLKVPPALEQYDQTRERLSDGFKARLRAELVEAKRLNELRNRIVHGLWLPQPGSSGDHWYTLRPRRYQLLMPLDPITIPEMHAAATAMEATATRVNRIGANIDHRIYGFEAPPGFD